MNDFKQQAQHITPKTNKKRPYGDYGAERGRKWTTKVKEIKKGLSGVTPPKGSILLKGESVLN